MQEMLRDQSSIPGSGRPPGGGNGNPLQYSCLKNPMDRGAWWATVHGVTNSLTRLKWLSMHALLGTAADRSEQETGFCVLFFLLPPGPPPLQDVFRHFSPVTSQYTQCFKLHPQSHFNIEIILLSIIKALKLSSCHWLRVKGWKFQTQSPKARG